MSLTPRQQEKLDRGEAIDVSVCPMNENGEYILQEPRRCNKCKKPLGSRPIHGSGTCACGGLIEPGEKHAGGFVEDKDYIDARNGRRIWSIGEHWDTGEILASTEPSGRFYGDPEFKCLWLR